jgi:hypothetical protein
VKIFFLVLLACALTDVTSKVHVPMGSGIIREASFDVAEHLSQQSHRSLETLITSLLQQATYCKLTISHKLKAYHNPS